MVRATFGGGAADFIATVGPGRVLRAGSGTITLWSAAEGGVQYTDLLLDGAPVTTISTDAGGQLPSFQGPDGVAVMWAEAGGSRVRLDPEGFPGGPASDEAVSTYVNTPASDTRSALDGLFVGAASGIAVPDGATLADLQVALDAAVTSGKRVMASGTITTSSTLTISCDADLSQLTINYTGTGTAVRVGTTSTSAYIFRKVVRLPVVIAANKAATGWAEVAGTVGYEIANAYGCTITTTRARGFETGTREAGYGQGVGYNTIHIGHMDSCKVPQHITQGDADGWVNQNTHIGGRHSVDSVEGNEISGVVAVKIDAMTTHPANNNTWVGTSFEGNAYERHADVAGVTNLFINCRWETTGIYLPKVRWRVGATGNVIMYGYMSNQIVETAEGGSGGVVCSNVILSRGTWKLGTGNSASGLLVLENTGGGTQPADVVMAPGARLAGTSPSTGYAAARSANESLFKRSTDAFARLKIDHQNGRVHVGNGTADPTRYFGAYGSSSMGFDGSSVGFITDNTYDLGMSGARPRYVRAGTAIQTGSGATGSRPSASTAGAGAVWFDTTLGKPIWSTGAGWVDSTGAAV